MPYQYFKDDPIENKMVASGYNILNTIGIQLNNFSIDAYNCQSLGDILWISKRAPLTSAINQNVFRQTFNEIFTQFQFAGTFEAYISVFKKIFGDDVMIEFVVPAPGKIQINIEAAGVELSDFIARSIVDNEYVFETVVDENEDPIQFQLIKGFQTQYELELMLSEMIPNGIVPDINLSLGA